MMSSGEAVDSTMGEISFGVVVVSSSVRDSLSAVGVVVDGEGVPMSAVLKFGKHSSCSLHTGHEMRSAVALVVAGGGEAWSGRSHSVEDVIATCEVEAMVKTV